MPADKLASGLSQPVVLAVDADQPVVLAVDTDQPVEMLADLGSAPVLRNPCLAYIALGANLGDAHAALLQAINALAAMPASSVLKVSSFYKTAPIESSGPDYLNAVAELSTGLTAPALLDALQAIENQAGRLRPYRNAPRTLDLDLLLYGSAQIDSPRLTVPHPRLFERAFVLCPLAEIAAHLVSQPQLQAIKDQKIVRL